MRYHLGVRMLDRWERHTGELGRFLNLMHLLGAVLRIDSSAVVLYNTQSGTQISHRFNIHTTTSHREEPMAAPHHRNGRPVRQNASAYHRLPTFITWTGALAVVIVLLAITLWKVVAPL